MGVWSTFRPLSFRVRTDHSSQPAQPSAASRNSAGS